ncbi:hypothetical protein SNE40_019451 [Patella caerulea]|uniref:Uncharacterized protein n=1 Tax=Patella caerulea TaxID=87958 RepID=A0AAN8J727_PATCE
MKAVFLILLLVIVSGVTVESLDLTRVEDQKGRLVVQGVIDAIRSNCIFAGDRLFLRRLAKVQSNDGLDISTYRADYHGGIWQIDEGKYNHTKGCPGHLEKVCDKIQTKLNISWPSTTWRDLRKPLYSGLSASLYIMSKQNISSNITDGLPGGRGNQSIIWKNLFAPNKAASSFLNSIRSSDEDEMCTKAIDLAFIIDSSGSIGSRNFIKIKQFMTNVTDGLAIASDKTQIAVVKFSTYARLEFGLNRYSSRASVDRAINRIYYDRGWTNTARGIDYASNYVFAAGRGMRNNSVKVAVVVTDGRSNNPVLTAAQAPKLRAKGVIVFSIGIGKALVEELEAISSEPNCTHVFVLKDFTEIESIINEIQKRACRAQMVFENTPTSKRTNIKEKVIPFTGNETEVNIVVPALETSNLPPNSTNSTTVVTDVSCGVVYIYASYDSTHPSDALYTYSDVAEEGSRSVMTVRDDSGRPLYISYHGKKYNITATRRNVDCEHPTINSTVMQGKEPVNGGWTEYQEIGDRTECSATCGSGTQTRTITRSCTNPAPSKWGKDCSGLSTTTEEVECNTRPCPVDGGWSNYAEPRRTTLCSATCGTGSRTRTLIRTCTRPAPSNGGLDCQGNSTKTEVVNCNTQPCPVDGGWSEFKEFGSRTTCSASCGTGTQTRTLNRTCTNPAPANGGLDCDGDLTKTEVVNCNTHLCPVNGGWSEYVETGSRTVCSASCGTGTQTRTLTRTCTNPAPANDGLDCEGISTKSETVDCNTHLCPVNGGWSEYEETGSRTTCSASCGTGTQTRTLTRTCTNPAPAYGGLECDGDSTKTEVVNCNTHLCPVNGGWSEFEESGSRTPCSASCGTGTQTRTLTRTCTNPAPANDGLDCDGDSTKSEVVDCNTQICPGWSEFSDWADYDECNVYCGSGTIEQRRSRTCRGGVGCMGNSQETRTVECNTNSCVGVCRRNIVRYFSHARNAKRFYQCDNGIAKLRKCAPTTVWSQDALTCIFENVPVPPQPTTEAPDTECANNQLFVAHPTDCSKYYRCVFGRRSATPMSCAPGLAFNEAISNCDFIANVPRC